MIVFSHSIPNTGGEYYIDLSEVTTSIQQIIMVFIKYSGQLGNDIFIVCSSWFLLESKKADVNKVVHIVVDSFLISALILMIFLSCGVQLPSNGIVKNLLPITMNANWFVGCYIIFYLIHPGLNTIITSMNQKQLLICDLTLAFFYCGIQTLIRDRFYYTQVVGFVCIYFFVAYMKKYMHGFVQSKKQNTKSFVVTASCFILSVLCLNLIGLKIGMLRHYLTTWSVITNPFLIIMSLALFNLNYS